MGSFACVFYVHAHVPLSPIAIIWYQSNRREGNVPTAVCGRSGLPVVFLSCVCIHCQLRKTEISTDCVDRGAVREHCWL